MANSEASMDDQGNTPADFRRKAIFNRMTQLGAAYLLLYVGLEVTIGGWGYNSYSKDGTGTSMVGRAGSSPATGQDWLSAVWSLAMLLANTAKRE